VAAASVTAVAALEEKVRGENHEGPFPIIVFAFDEWG